MVLNRNAESALSFIMNTEVQYWKMEQNMNVHLQLSFSLWRTKHLNRHMRSVEIELDLHNTVYAVLLQNSRLTFLHLGRYHHPHHQHPDLKESKQ